MQKEYTVLKANEAEAERALDRLEWEFGKVREARAKRRGKPKTQGELF